MAKMEQVMAQIRCEPLRPDGIVVGDGRLRVVVQRRADPKALDAFPTPPGPNRSRQILRPDTFAGCGVSLRSHSRERKPQLAADDPWGFAAVQGHGAGSRKKGDGRPSGEFAVPPDLRHRLATWIDVDAVGADGFWLWLGTVLPLLPGTTTTGAGPGSAIAPHEQRLRELARDLVDCARERTHLHVLCEQYYTDNQSLSRRVKALEAALRTFNLPGRPVEVSDDAGSADAAERYLPRM